MSEITTTKRRALEILRDHGPMRPAQFANIMWPDSECWKHRTRCGHGVTVGGGMRLAAGGFLGKLCKQGLAVRYTFSEGINISQDGRDILRTQPPSEQEVE